MALADITQTGDTGAYQVELLASVTAANGIPTTTAGVAMSVIRAKTIPMPGSGFYVGVRSTAGSGTMTATLRLWGRAGGAWQGIYEFDASSTAPQTPIAIGETSADAIQYFEPAPDLRAFDRIFLEVVAIAGTNTAVTGFLLVPAIT